MGIIVEEIARKNWSRMVQEISQDSIETFIALG